MQLCTFSKSAIHHSRILKTCPLNLTRTEGKHCPCRKRLYHVPPNDLRVLSCQYPDDWRGERIRNEEAVRRNISRKLGKEPPVMASNTEPAPDKKDQENQNALAAVQAKPSTALTMYDRVRDPMDFINKMGVTFFNSKMYGCANVDQGRALAFGFMVNRIDPFSWSQRHHIIGGNVTMSAEAMLADFRKICGGKHKIISRTPDKAAVELQVGREKQIFEMTWEEALSESYVYTTDANNNKVQKFVNGSVNPKALKDNWSTPRSRMQMLWARVISDGVGAMAPEVPAGQQTPEELGVIGSEIQGEIIDAEFEVQEEVAVPSQQATAPPEPEQPSSGSPVPAAEAESESAEPGELATESGNQSSAAPSSAPGAFETKPDLDAEKRTMLRKLKRLKDELLTAEQYAKVLDKRGVKSALDLDIDQLAYIVSGLEARKEKKEVAEGKDPVSQWAKEAVNPKEGPSGN